MAAAARHGLEQPDALQVAAGLYVQADASRTEGLRQLPASCAEAADCLVRDRERYEAGGVFPAGLIDALAHGLRAYGDRHLSERICGDAEALRNLVNRHLHCG
jgi:glutamine synthetase